VNDRDWYTIETPHFRITYHSDVEQVAQRVANVCEGIFGTMGTAVGWTPSEPTEIILTDFSESANGSAGALPYNAIHLIVTAPEDMSPLGNVDDWFLELVTHDASKEVTIILHEHQTLTGEAQARINGRKKRYVRFLEASFREAMAAGQIRQVDPTIASFALLGTVLWTYKWYRPEGRMNPAQLETGMIDIFFNGLVA
jgi:hypothetical protein